MNQTYSEVQKPESAKGVESSGRELAAFSLAIALASGFLSVAQGIFFLLEQNWRYYDVLAVVFSVAALFLAWRCLVKHNSRLVVGILVLLSAQFGVFVFKLVGTEHLSSLRLMQAAIVVFYVATVISVLLASTRILAPFKALSLSFSLATGILLGEIMLDFPAPAPSGKAAGFPRWVGTMEPHPELGEVYRPYSVLKTYYPDNPRGYFKLGDIREVKWALRVIGGNVANLEFPPKDPEMVRVAIERARSPEVSDIQLNQPRLRVKAKQRYALRFRARADSPRSIIVGFAKAHEPWTNIGLYRKIELTTQWQDFEENFAVTENEDNARIHFDVGENAIPVDLSSVSLRSLLGGQSIEANIPSNSYFVSYKFNALGCRGRDYNIPRPPQTVRVLLLGDSVTLGMGVHEADTFGNRLEGFLNEEFAANNSGKNYEVINCGVSGYGTREERLFYELFGGKYQPDVVLLVMVWNDDMSFHDEVQRGYVNRVPGQAEILFQTWGKIQSYRYQHPFHDFSKSSEEIIRLNKEIREHGARLAVVVFRADRGEISQRLTDQVTKGLQGTGIPILDLGTAFLKHSYQDVIVHSVDEHPNEIAHGIAAREILSFLQEKGWLRDEKQEITQK